MKKIIFLIVSLWILLFSNAILLYKLTDFLKGVDKDKFVGVFTFILTCLQMVGLIYFLLLNKNENDN